MLSECNADSSQDLPSCSCKKMVLLLEVQESGSGWAAGRASASSAPKVVSGGSLVNSLCNEERKLSWSKLEAIVVRENAAK